MYSIHSLKTHTALKESPLFWPETAAYKKALQVRTLKYLERWPVCRSLTEKALFIEPSNRLLCLGTKPQWESQWEHQSSSKLSQFGYGKQLRPISFSKKNAISKKKKLFDEPGWPRRFEKLYLDSSFMSDGHGIPLVFNQLNYRSKSGDPQRFSGEIAAIGWIQSVG